jgi:hypothetical protein
MGLNQINNQSYANGLGINLGQSGITENRPYSAKNSGYNRTKSYSSKSKKREMKKSSSKKSPTAGRDKDSRKTENSHDVAPVFYNKYNHPSGIGLYQPGKIKLAKDKQSVSSRGSARWNKSPNNPKYNRTSNAVKVSNLLNPNLNFIIGPFKQLRGYS